MFSQHAFVKKEWYNVHVPSIFDVRVPTLQPVLDGYRGARTATGVRERRREFLGAPDEVTWVAEREI